MSTTVPASYPRTAAPLPVDARRTALIGLTSAGVALAVNLAVLGVVGLAGADMVVRQDASSSALTVGVGLVAVTTVVPVLLASALLLPLRRWGARAWRATAFVGLAVGLVTVFMPLSMVAEASTRAALVVMHVVTGLVWFVVVSRAARRAEG